MDFHDDFFTAVDPVENQELDAELRSLDLNNAAQMLLFSASRLDRENADHIYHAMKLDIIGDVYSVIKAPEHAEDQNVTDIFGNNHCITYLKRPDDLTNERVCDGPLIWDLDLDYFCSPDPERPNQTGPRLTDDQITPQLLPTPDWMQHVLCCLAGMTIALEPFHTGGLVTSLDLYKLLEDSLFTAPIGSDKCEWRTSV